jgi:hypothetical protein
MREICWWNNDVAEAVKTKEDFLELHIKQKRQRT